MEFRMRQAEKHDETKTEQEDLRGILGKYLPGEQSTVARLLNRLFGLWPYGKFLLVGIGLLVILRAAQIIDQAYAAIPTILLKGLRLALTYFKPLLLELLAASLKYLWQPIFAYVLIILFTKSKVWRQFWYLVGAAGFFLIFVAALERSSWREYHLLPLFAAQSYLFILWLVPREIWNFIGLAISIVFGLIILILPDLPTAFDDFGMFGAILAFFLGYLNALASLLQRLGKRF